MWFVVPVNREGMAEDMWNCFMQKTKASSSHSVFMQHFSVGINTLVPVLEVYSSKAFLGGTDLDNHRCTYITECRLCPHKSGI